MNENQIIIYALLAAIVLMQIATIVAVKKKNEVLVKKTATADNTDSSVIVDTCALIDGRIRDLVKAGFVTQRICIPQRVLEELQFLADNGDAYKRSRARYGLDVARSLQEIAPQQVIIIDGGRESKEVDDALIELALQHSAALYTTDYNLNKVAKIRGVMVMNVNELAHALRPIFLPGETVNVKIVQKGESLSQGVGYLEDGTMTVVEGAAQRVGSHVTAHVERMLQTEAGKMVFASVERPKNPNSNHGNSQNNRSQNLKPVLRRKTRR